MRGYITTCGGETFRLPTLTAWNVDYTFSVPCDSFTVQFPYSQDMLGTLGRAVRFTAYDGEEEQFYGVVDEYCVTENSDGRTVWISGRGMAALLLDNESKAVEYQYPTATEIIRKHVTPYGIVCENTQNVTQAAPYSVSSGSSQWKAVRDFAEYYGGFEPRFTKTGNMIFAPWKDNGSSLVINSTTPVLAMEYRDNRYGVISEILLVNRSSGSEQAIKNSDFTARGGLRRQVLYVPNSTSVTRYTGEYQIEKSKKGKRTLTITIPKTFAVFPFETALLSRKEMGINGRYMVTEAENRFEEDGETSVLSMCEVDE